eukprot:g66872.t1
MALFLLVAVISAAFGNPNSNLGRLRRRMTQTDYCQRADYADPAIAHCLSCPACPAAFPTACNQPCAICEGGYYKSGNACVACADAKCISCTDSVNCTKCANGYFPFPFDGGVAQSPVPCLGSPATCGTSAPEVFQPVISGGLNLATGGVPMLEITATYENWYYNPKMFYRQCNDGTTTMTGPEQAAASPYCKSSTTASVNYRDDCSFNLLMTDDNGNLATGNDATRYVFSGTLVMEVNFDVQFIGGTVEGFYSRSIGWTLTLPRLLTVESNIAVSNPNQCTPVTALTFGVKTALDMCNYQGCSYKNETYMSCVCDGCHSGQYCEADVCAPVLTCPSGTFNIQLGQQLSLANATLSLLGAGAPALATGQDNVASGWSDGPLTVSRTIVGSTADVSAGDNLLVYVWSAAALNTPYTVSYTFTDASTEHNAASCSFTVRVSDVGAPVLSCPAGPIVTNQMPVWAAQVSADDNIDASPTITQTAGDVSGAFTANTKQTVSYQAQDDSGNTATCNFDVTYQTSAPTVVSCPSASPAIDLALPATTDYVTVLPSHWTGVEAQISFADTLSGLAGPLSFSGDAAPRNYSIANLGSKTFAAVRVYSQSNNAGNTATCTVAVRVYDNTAPVVTCPNPAVVNLVADAGKSYATSATTNVAALFSAHDNVMVSTYNSPQATYAITSGSGVPHTFTYTATDPAGNSASCSASIYVQDTQLPVILCPGDLTVYMDYGTNTFSVPIIAVPWSAPVVIDNDDAFAGAAQPYNFVLGSTVLAKGAHLLRYKVTDPTGNQNNCSFTVTVADNQAPQFTACPSSTVTRTTAPGQNYYVTNLDGSVVMYSDNDALDTTTASPAEGSQVAWTGSPAAVSYTARDVTGNTAVCAFSLLVSDAEPPTINCANQALSTDALSDKGTKAGGWPFTASDNVAVAGAIAYAPGSLVFLPGSYAIKATVLDTAGNVGQCNFTLDVTQRCGDLYVLGGEECDHGPGCNATCKCDRGASFVPRTSIAFHCLYRIPAGVVKTDHSLSGSVVDAGGVLKVSSSNVASTGYVTDLDVLPDTNETYIAHTAGLVQAVLGVQFYDAAMNAASSLPAGAWLTGKLCWATNTISYTPNFWLLDGSPCGREVVNHCQLVGTTGAPSPSYDAATACWSFAVCGSGLVVAGLNSVPDCHLPLLTTTTSNVFVTPRFAPGVNTGLDRLDQTAYTAKVAGPLAGSGTFSAKLGSYAVPGFNPSGTFTATVAPAAQLEVDIQTVTIYGSTSNNASRFQLHWLLRDANGRLTVASGASITVTSTDPNCVAGNCGIYSVTQVNSYYPKGYSYGHMGLSEFSSTSRTRVLTVQLYVSGVLKDTKTVTVSLAALPLTYPSYAAVSAVTPASGGSGPFLFLEMPNYKLYPGRSFTVLVFFSTGKSTSNVQYNMNGGSFNLLAPLAWFTYNWVSWNTTSSAVWGAKARTTYFAQNGIQTSVSGVDAVITVPFTTSSNYNSQSQTIGYYLPLCSITFTVKSGVAEGTASLYGASVMLNTDNMPTEPNGYYYFGVGTQLRFADLTATPYTTTGAVVVVQPAVKGIYPYLNTNTYSSLLNTNALTGVCTSATSPPCTNGIYASYYYDAPFTVVSDSQVGVESCLSDSPIDVRTAMAGSGTTANCVVRAVSCAGSVSASVTIQIGGYGTSAAFQVYTLVDSLAVSVNRFTLRKFAADGSFESAYVTVLANLTSGASGQNLNNMDVTGLMNFDQLTTGLSYANRLVTVSSGPASGSVTKYLTSTGSGVSIAFSVTTATATYVQLKAFSFSSITVAPSASQNVAPGALTTVTVSPVLSLTQVGHSAKVVVFALDDNAQYTDVSSEATVVAARSEDLSLAQSGGVWTATVPYGAASLDFGEHLNVSWKGFSGKGSIFTVLPASIGIIVQVQNAVVPAGSAASKSPINGVACTQLKIWLVFIDGTQTEMTYSSFTQLNTSASGYFVQDYASNTKFCTNADTPLGSLLVYASFPTMTAGTSKAYLLAPQNATVKVFDVSSIAPQLDYYLPYKSAALATVGSAGTLSTVACTSTYQVARFKTVATLSAGCTTCSVDVSSNTAYTTTAGASFVTLSTISGATYVQGLSAGTATFQAAFPATGSLVSAGGLSVTVQTAASPLLVSSVSLAYSSSTLSGTGGTTRAPISVSFTFANGSTLSPLTQFASALPNGMGGTLSDILSFASNDDTRVAVGANSGVLTLVKNSYVVNTVTASATCASNAGLVKTASYSVYANLYPTNYDAKLGNTAGLTFAAMASYVDVPVYCNVGSKYMAGCQVAIAIDTRYIDWSAFLSYMGASGGTCSTRSTYCISNPNAFSVGFVLGTDASYIPGYYTGSATGQGQFIQVQVSDSTVSKTGNVQLCTLRLPLLGGASGRYGLGGFVVQMRAANAAGGSNYVYDFQAAGSDPPMQAIVSGDAFVVLNGNTALAADISGTALRRRRAMQSTTNPPPVGPFPHTGDTNGDGFVSLSDTSNIALAAATFASTATNPTMIYDGKIPISCVGCFSTTTSPVFSFGLDTSGVTTQFLPLLQAFTPTLHHMNPYVGTPTNGQWLPDRASSYWRQSAMVAQGGMYGARNFSANSADYNFHVQAVGGVTRFLAINTPWDVVQALPNCISTEVSLVAYLNKVVQTPANTLTAAACAANDVVVFEIDIPISNVNTGSVMAGVTVQAAIDGYVLVTAACSADGIHNASFHVLDWQDKDTYKVGVWVKTAMSNSFSYFGVAGDLQGNTQLNPLFQGGFPIPCSLTPSVSPTRSPSRTPSASPSPSVSPSASINPDWLACVNTTAVTADLTPSSSDRHKAAVNLDLSARATILLNGANHGAFLAASTDYLTQMNILGGASSGTFAWPPGTWTVTVYATDGVEVKGSCSFSVAVSDKTPPTLDCNASAQIMGAMLTSQNYKTFQLPTVTATDETNFAPARSGVYETDDTRTVTPTIVFALDGFVQGSTATFKNGSSVVTWTIADAAGNQAEPCVYTYTVLDTQAPALTCPDRTINASASTGTGVLGQVQISVADNFDAPRQDAVTFSQAWTIARHTLTYSTTDAAGNAASCSFSLTVNDVTSPTVTCPANFSVNSAAAQANVYWSVAYADNDVANVALASSPTNGSLFAVHSTSTVTVQVEDQGSFPYSSGNTATCSFTVTVVDVAAPTLTCPGNKTVSTSSEYAAAEWIAPQTINSSIGITDNDVGPTSLGCNTNDMFPVYAGSATGSSVTLVRCTGKDRTGNLGSCAFSVTVRDTGAPYFSGPAIRGVSPSCPGAVSLLSAAFASTTAAGGDAGLGLYPLPVAVDYKGVTSLSSDLALGANKLAYLASDAAGNQAWCNFTLTLTDTKLPVFTSCPSDTQTNITYVNANTISFPLAASDDFTAAGALVWTFSASKTVGQAAPSGGSTTVTGLGLGATTLTYTATDGANNAQSCTFTVTVLDNIPPLLTCPVSVNSGVKSFIGSADVKGSHPAYTVRLATPSTTTRTVSWPAAAVSDNAGTGGVSLAYSVGGSSSSSTSVSLAHGKHDVTVTATDGANNAKTCSFTVDLWNAYPELGVLADEVDTAIARLVIEETAPGVWESEVAYISRVKWPYILELETTPVGSIAGVTSFHEDQSRRNCPRLINAQGELPGAYESVNTVCYQYWVMTTSVADCTAISFTASIQHRLNCFPGDCTYSNTPVALDINVQSSSDLCDVSLSPVGASARAFMLNAADLSSWLSTDNRATTGIAGVTNPQDPTSSDGDPTQSSLFEDGTSIYALVRVYSNQVQFASADIFQVKRSSYSGAERTPAQLVSTIYLVSNLVKVAPFTQISTCSGCTGWQGATVSDPVGHVDYAYVSYVEPQLSPSVTEEYIKLTVTVQVNYKLGASNRRVLVDYELDVDPAERRALLQGQGGEESTSVEAFAAMVLQPKGQNTKTNVVPAVTAQNTNNTWNITTIIIIVILGLVNVLCCAFFTAWCVKRGKEIKMVEKKRQDLHREEQHEREELEHERAEQRARRHASPRQVSPREQGQPEVPISDHDHETGDNRVTVTMSPGSSSRRTPGGRSVAPRTSATGKFFNQRKSQGYEEVDLATTGSTSGDQTQQ